MSDEEEYSSGSSSSSSEEEETGKESSVSEEDDSDVYSCGAGYGLDYDPWAIAVEAKQFTVIGGGLIPGVSNLKAAAAAKKKPASGKRSKHVKYPTPVKKSVTFCAADRLVAIRDISPRSDSPYIEELEFYDPDEDNDPPVRGSALVGSYNVKKSNNSRNVVARITGQSTYGSLQRSITRNSLNNITSKQPNKRPNAARGNRSAGRGGRKPTIASGFRSQGKPSVMTSNPKFSVGPSRELQSSSWGSRKFGSPISYPGGTRDSRVRSSSAKPGMLSADSRSLITGGSNPLRLDSDNASMPFSLTATRVHPSPYRHGSAPPGKRTDPNDISKDFKELRLGAGFGDVSDLKIDTRLPGGSSSANKKVYAWHLANGTLPGASVQETPCISQMWDSTRHTFTSSSTTT